ncbi:hypothetical protein QPK87_03955 [Kamptonema cortianum]|nr:hypothetical protein [Oscillatoria laete-virens]MDK3155733.1 hypothetical protein [Kamptonema cortianum]MDL5048035.1 hypothetical protein [Oscillatoria amoena NRMC-F 0135]MDL5052517.1 hypothetical protein [Oscillatoria laete-virens NRMC-F 0139]
MNTNHKYCPYTLKPLTELSETNNEHIFADAIGGTGDYTVRVDAKMNSQLGITVDSAFVDSPLLAMFRSRLGIKSRSGPSKWKLRGTTEGTNRPVEVVFESGGHVEVHYRKPVELDASGTTGTIIVAPEKRDAFLGELTRNLKRKGKAPYIVHEVLGLVEPVKLNFTIELDALKQGLLKIAFLAAYKFLGDAFLCDPLILEWHKAVLSKSNYDATSAKIHGTALEPNENVNILLPDLHEYEHAVAVFNLQQQGPFVVVKLFGCDLLSSLCRASETSNFGLQPLDGIIVICDTKARKVRTIRFADHLEERAKFIMKRLRGSNNNILPSEN